MLIGCYHLKEKKPFMQLYQERLNKKVRRRTLKSTVYNYVLSYTLFFYKNQ